MAARPPDKASWRDAQFSSKFPPFKSRAQGVRGQRREQGHLAFIFYGRRSCPSGCRRVTIPASIQYYRSFSCRPHRGRRLAPVDLGRLPWGALLRAQPLLHRELPSRRTTFSSMRRRLECSVRHFVRPTYLASEGFGASTIRSSACRSRESRVTRRRTWRASRAFTTTGRGSLHPASTRRTC